MFSLFTSHLNQAQPAKASTVSPSSPLLQPQVGQERYSRPLCEADLFLDALTEFIMSLEEEEQVTDSVDKGKGRELARSSEGAGPSKISVPHSDVSLSWIFWTSAG